MMQAVLDEFLRIDASAAAACSNAWTLHPVLSTTANMHDLRSSQLSAILENAVVTARQRRPNATVVLLGMDAPELPMAELVAVCSCSNNSDHMAAGAAALLCPAADGGYGLLSVPSSADAARIFAGVQWSHPLTAVSQLKALTDSFGSGISSVILGPLVHDIDTPDDVHALVTRLQLPTQQQQPNAGAASSSCCTADDCLSRPSALVTLSATCVPPSSTLSLSCRHTRQALIKLGLLLLPKEE